MVQRSRVAAESDVRSLRKHGGKAPWRPAQAAARHLAALALLAALVYALPSILGPGFLHDQARGVAAFATTTGEWVRAALAAAFRSIPVW